MPPATAGRPAAHAREHLLQLLRPVVEQLGYELDDITVTSAGRRSLIRVSVDADSVIDLDGVAIVSRAVSDTLDSDERQAAMFAGPYVLEVSSPGVERPLTEPRHWRRTVGRLVQVPAGGSTVTGRVRAVSDRSVTLDIAGTERELTWSELGAGRVQVEFNRAAEDEP